MTYWTILLVTYLSGDFRGEASPLPIPDAAKCSAAIEPTFELLTSEAQQVMVQCVETQVPSGSIRPRKNPFYG